MMCETNNDSHLQVSAKNIPSRLRNFASAAVHATAITLRGKRRKSLPANYSPSPIDICCGRGKAFWNHEGNASFRKLIQSRVFQYVEAPTKLDKTSVVVGIVEELRDSGVKFLKQDCHGRWYDIGDLQAREKVGHSLRDQVTSLVRQQSKRELFSSQQESTKMQRRPSGEEIEVRRTSFSTNDVFKKFERRPSGIASACADHDSYSSKRKSVIMAEEIFDHRMSLVPAAVPDVLVSMAQSNPDVSDHGNESDDKHDDDDEVERELLLLKASVQTLTLEDKALLESEDHEEDDGFVERALVLLKASVQTVTADENGLLDDYEIEDEMGRWI